MKLWLLKLIEIDGFQYGYGGYDCAYGFVVRAKDEEQARLLASLDHGDETESVWRDPTKSTCVELTAEGEAEMIIRDFLNS